MASSATAHSASSSRLYDEKCSPARSDALKLKRYGGITPAFGSFGKQTSHFRTARFRHEPMARQRGPDTERVPRGICAGPAWWFSPPNALLGMWPRKTGISARLTGRSAVMEASSSQPSHPVKF